jgi:mannose-6-phosphate isomerase-like protein (cupin superfamily)
MRKLIQSLRLVSIAVMAGSWMPATAGDRTAEYNSTAEINASVTKTVDGSAAHLLESDASTPVYVIRRDGPGKVEVHRKLNDVIVIREGTVSVLIGERVEGNQEVKPNEWLGGKIVGGTSYTLAAGDVLFIPAGLGHLMTPPPGGTVTYLVVKTDAK